MSRTQLILILLTMPFWLGIGMVLWTKNPLFVLIPCGLLLFVFLLAGGAFAYVAELYTVDDWDLVIRSVLFRLGFKVQPPKSLMRDIDLNNVEGWHHHHHDHAHQHDTKEDND